MSMQSLWAEVLFQAIQDALHGPAATSGDGKEARLHEARHARLYVTRPNKDFNMVCTLAGVDPIATREALTKQIAQAPSPEQLINQPRPTNSPKHTHNGQTKTVVEWAEQTGTSAQTLHSRLHAGWSIERALTTPVQQRAKCNA